MRAPLGVGLFKESGSGDERSDDVQYREDIYVLWSDNVGVRNGGCSVD